MKFGICCSDSFIPTASSLGFDYVELGVTTVLLPDVEDETLLAGVRHTLDEYKLDAEAFNFMLAPGLKCVGANVDWDRIKNYFRRAMPRASYLGAKVLVFGSGTQRTIPDGFDREEAREQFKRAVILAAESAEPHGIKIAIEPLNHLESNLINTVAEGAALAAEAHHRSVTVLSDLYHVVTDRQDFAETTNAGPQLTHVHVAGHLRRAPIGDDIEVLTRYFTAVKAAGYDDRVSIEVNWENMEFQAEEALHVVRQAWAAA